MKDSILRNAGIMSPMGLMLGLGHKETVNKRETMSSIFSKARTKQRTTTLGERVSAFFKKPVSSQNPDGLTSESFLPEKNLKKLKKFHPDIKDKEDFIKYGFDSIETYLSNYNYLRTTHADHVDGLAKRLKVGKAYVLNGDYVIVPNSEDSEKKLFEGLQVLGFSKIGDFSIGIFDDRNRLSSFISFSSTDFIDRISTIDGDVFTAVEKLLTENFRIKSDSVKLSTLKGIALGNLEITDEILSTEESMISPTEFYPWMDGMDPGSYFDEFFESDANVLLLYGMAGTGKSSLIRTGLVKTGVSGLLVSDTKIAADPDFVAKIGNAMKTGGHGVLIIEDADALMIPRSEGNLSLSRLLSYTSGVGTSDQFKIILTTNADDTAKIDSALVRPGRCFDIMQFGRLNPDEARAARNAVGLEEVKIAGPVSLAAALSYSPSQTMKSAQDNETSIVSPRFPLKKN